MDGVDKLSADHVQHRERFVSSKSLYHWPNSYLLIQVIQLNSSFNFTEPRCRFCLLCPIAGHRNIAFNCVAGWGLGGGLGTANRLKFLVLSRIITIGHGT